jgi:hypothetical protein
MIDTTPTLAGFITFCRNVVGIPTVDMPDADAGFQTSLDYANLWIPDDLAKISPGLFTAATYNWAASLLIQYQQDVAGQIFFTSARQSFGISNFVPGVISNASNEATSQGMTIGKGLSNMSLTDLQRVKDPYGRQALAILMDTGTLWGLT